MAVLPRLSPRDLVLQTMASDTEDAPWMVMSGLQVRAVDLLKAILQLHARRHRLPWVIESYLLIKVPRPVGTRTLDAAPDLMVAVGEDRLRTSWSIAEEGKAPEFALEVVADSSWERDREDKPMIYEGMGVAEFALFYPTRKDGGPMLFGFRRRPDGAHEDWPIDALGGLWSETLGLSLVIEDGLWLRLRDRQGRLLPSPAELVEAEAAAYQEAQRRADAEAAAREEAQRRADAADRRAEGDAAARQEAARQAAAERAAAEAELERLREELRRLREGRPWPTAAPRFTPAPTPGGATARDRDRGRGRRGP